MKSPVFLSGVLILCLFSCSNQAEESSQTVKAENVSMLDSVAIEASEEVAEGSAPVSSKAAVENPIDTVHKFVRTADVRFQAENAARSTMAIEDVVISHGGFITESKLQSQVIEKDTREFSPDSLIETTRFTVSSNLIIRVPSNQLYEVLKGIGAEVKFLDSRNVQSEDVRLTLLAGQMSQNRIVAHTKRLEKGIDTKGKKLTDIADIENNLLEKENMTDQNYIEKLDLQDQIKFSTVSLEIYESEKVKHSIVANPARISKYEPGLFFRIGDSILAGWRFVENVLVILIRIWPILLLITGSYFIYKRYLLKSAVSQK